MPRPLHSRQAVLGVGAWEAPRSAGLGSARAARFVKSDSPRLFERSERSERSELRGASPDRASQGSRRPAPTASVAPTTGTACRDTPTFAGAGRMPL